MCVRKCEHMCSGYWRNERRIRTAGWREAVETCGEQLTFEELFAIIEEESGQG
jgi:hypothetical protein